MKLSLFYRKPSPQYHSIEQLFDNISCKYSNNIKLKKVYAKYKSKGFFKRIRIGFQTRKNQSDINHITGDIHFIAPFLKKKKTILTIHDIGAIKSSNLIKNIILKLFWFSIPIKSVAYITVISEFTKIEILKNFNISPEKIIVIPNCISSKYKFKKKSFNSSKPNILQIGTKKNKNILRIIEAIKDINCKLLIVGKLNEDQKLSLHKNNIDYEVFFDISDNELIQLYENTDIVSFVSTYEGFGLPVIEANAVGRVVITSNIEPMHTIAANAAYKVNPLDVNEIKKGVENLIKDSALREMLIKNGLTNAKKYTAKAIALQYEKLYKELSL
ncbi:MAG: hypothetical protein B6I20_11895 [Bacteroidetes bacterium 4572_117]|nr:MAG: hypothetical protein B6I20_11895 [Bacteroidetes bacterium 4572_117]